MKMLQQERGKDFQPVDDTTNLTPGRPGPVKKMPTSREGKNVRPTLTFFGRIPPQKSEHIGQKQY